MAPQRTPPDSFPPPPNESHDRPPCAYAVLDAWIFDLEGLGLVSAPTAQQHVADMRRQLQDWSAANLLSRFDYANPGEQCWLCSSVGLIGYLRAKLPEGSIKCDPVSGLGRLMQRLFDGNHRGNVVGELLQHLPDEYRVGHHDIFEWLLLARATDLFSRAAKSTYVLSYRCVHSGCAQANTANVEQWARTCAVRQAATELEVDWGIVLPSQEVLSGCRCPHCGTEQNAQATVCSAELSPVLVVNFKRGDATSDAKADYVVGLSTPLAAITPSGLRGVEYALTAVVRHHGDRTSAGHSPWCALDEERRSAGSSWTLAGRGIAHGAWKCRKF